MNTENNDSTATDVAETETEEISVPATAETEETIAAEIDVDDTETTADVEADQEDEEASEDEQEEAYDPNDPLFGDNAPTVSVTKPVSLLKKLGALIGLLLVAVGIFGTVVIGNAVADYADARWETDCIQGQRVEARIPSDFDGNLRAYIAAGNNVTELGSCDNIAWQR
jgi:hypothetical protein